MVKKTSYIIIAVALVIAGVFAFARLNYWERSIRIFSMGKIGQSFEGRGERGTFRYNGESGEPEEFDGFRGSGSGDRREGRRDMPDSLRTRFGAHGHTSFGAENLADSIRRQFAGDRGERFERFERGSGSAVRRGDHGFTGGRKVNLRSVAWFLAVFAAFAVAGVYADKLCVVAYKRGKE